MEMFSLSLASVQSHKKLDTLLAKEESSTCNFKFGPMLILGMEE